MNSDEYSIIDGGNAAHFGVLAAAVIATTVAAVITLLRLILYVEIKYKNMCFSGINSKDGELLSC